MKKILIREIQVGDILAQHIFLPNTGLPLIKGGTVITPVHLRYLEKYELTDLECFIMDESAMMDMLLPEEERIMANNFRSDVIRSIRETTVKKTLAATYLALESLNEEARENRPLTLSKVNNVSSVLVNRILENNNVMLQMAALKAISEYTFSHSVNVAIYAINLGRLLGLNEESLKGLAMAGLLHDIGKMSIPPEIIEKPEKLTPQEFEQIKSHSIKGYLRLTTKTKDLPRETINAVLQHHEKLDGSGYPNGLQGSFIHLWARILSIADIYDAMTSDRCYREAFLPHETVEYLLSLCSQGSLDRELIELFVQNTSFYPPGCKVLLNTGEKGTVVDYPWQVPVRPTIEIISPTSLQKIGKAKQGKLSTPANKKIELEKDLTVFITAMWPP